MPLLSPRGMDIMTSNPTRLELIYEGAYIRFVTKYVCKICDEVHSTIRELKEHQIRHTEQEFIQAL